MGTSLDGNFKLWKENVKFRFQFKAFYEQLLSKAQYPPFHKRCSFQGLPSCVFSRLRVPQHGLGTAWAGHSCQLPEPVLGHWQKCSFTQRLRLPSTSCVPCRTPCAPCGQHSSTTCSLGVPQAGFRADGHPKHHSSAVEMRFVWKGPQGPSS